MVTVVSPQLLAVAAAWDDGPDAGRWIADRLGPFGAAVGHAVPLGYAAYAVVPIVGLVYSGMPTNHERSSGQISDGGCCHTSRKASAECSAPVHR